MTLRLLREAEAAEFLGMARGTLRNWRVYGIGPEWVKLPNGSVRYRVADLMEWIESREKK